MQITKEEADKSAICRILSVELLNSLGRPKQSSLTPLLASALFEIVPLLQIEEYPTKYYPPLFPNSQQLIQSCAVTTRPVYRALLPVRMLQDRTLPDLPSIWPWEIWVRD